MPNAPDNRRHSRLLVVDDDADHLRALTRIFRDEGFDVVGCSTATGALEHLAGEGIGVAVIDLRLPDLSGTELLAKLEGLSEPIQVIIHTAYGSFESAKEAINLGAFAYVEKGTEYNELIHHVHRAFRARLERYAAQLEDAVAERTSDLHEANRELRTREYLHRKAEEIGGLGSFQVNMRTGKQEWSDQVFHLLGLQPGDVPSTYDSFLQFVHPDDRDRLDALSQRTFAGEEHLEVRYRIIRSGGEERHLHTRGEIECTEDGTPTWILGFTQDVTEQSRAEKQLRDNEQRFRLLYERSPLAYQALDEEGRLLEVNDAWLEMLGYSRKEVIGRSFGDFLTPEYVENFKENFPRFIAMGDVSNVMFEMIRKDRSQITTEVDGRVGYDNDGSYQQTHCILRDITERRRAEEALRESEAKFRTVAEQSPEMIFINKMGRIVYANSRCEEVTGYSRDEQLSHDFDFRTLFPPDGLETLEPSFKAHREGKEIPPYESTLISKAGNRFQVIISTKLIEYQGETAILGIVTDVTDQKRAEGIAAAQRDLAMALSSTTGLEEGLRMSVEAALRISGMDCGGVYLVDENSGTVDLLFHQGLSEDFVNAASHYNRESDHVRLVMAGEPVYAVYNEVPVELTEPERRENLSALAVLPVKHEGRVIGCLNVASHALAEVPANARAALEAISGQLGSSLARLKTEEETRELAQAAVELVRLSPIEDIEGFICDKVRALAGNAIVGVSAIDVEHKTLRIRKMTGFDPDSLKTVDGLLGQRVSEGAFEGVHAEAVCQLASGKLTKLEGGPSQLFFGRVPESVCDSIEQTIGARDVYSIGLVREGRLLGNVSILPTAGASLNGNAIEAFVNAASIALERKQAQEQLRQRENELTHMARISTMGEMAGEMAHELNQPLYAITNYATGATLQLLNEAADPRQLTEVMEKITQQARRASDIIRRLGNTVRSREPHRSTTYLNDIVRDVLELVEHEFRQNSVSVHLDLQEKLPPVFADAIQIQQIVVNLIHNALEAMHDVPSNRKRLTLTTTAADDQSVVEVAVGDGGKGLDAGIREKIFDPLFSTKANGLGMGLAISRTIVEAHEGRIWATPNTPHGTVFRFVIPTAKQGTNRAH